MTTASNSGAETHSVRLVGVADPQVWVRVLQRRNDAMRAAWAVRVRCAAISKTTGMPCGNRPTPGKLCCRFHGGHLTFAELLEPRDRAGRRRPPKRQPPNRQHVRELRKHWRVDPWVTGFTLMLDLHGQQRLETWLAAGGITWHWLSPRVQDIAKWAFLNACRAGLRAEQDSSCARILEHIRQQDRLDGLEPPGPHPDRMAASRRLARYREVPPLGEKAPGWSSPARKRSKRAAMSAAQQLARDLALASLETCESRKQAIERQLALDRLRLRARQEEAGARQDQQARSWRSPVDRGGW